MRPRQQWHHRGGPAGRRGDDRPLTAPLPAAFHLSFGDARRPAGEVLIGGSPIRVLRLTPAGAEMVDRWMAGEAVGPSTGARALAGRLVDAGIANPRPAGGTHPSVTDCTFVIPVRDQPAELQLTLAHLTGLGQPIIVVDDGSRSPVEAAAQVIRHPRSTGPAAARNTGWRASGSEVVVFVDAGCVPASGWLDGLLAHLADPAVAASAPRITAAASPGTPRWLAVYERLRSPLDLGPAPAAVRPLSRVSYVPAATLLMRRQALDAVGGFEESMRYGEDVDLVWRLYEAGWRVRYEPGAQVSHPGRRTTAAWLEQRFRYGSSAADLAARHGRAVTPLLASPWSAAVWAFGIGGHPLAGAAVAAGTGAALARRAKGDRATARALAGLALTGNLKAGSELARAVRTAWLPPLALAAAVSPPGFRRRLMGAAGVALAGPAVVEWWSRAPRLSLPAWTALRLADDLAYQAGLWSGVWRRRSAGALWPKW